MEALSARMKRDWNEEEFNALGRQTLANDILTDMENIWQGKDPKAMRVLEIGCATRPNARIWNNNGVDLSVLPGENLLDFALSICVFHHVPSREVIENDVRELGRLLKPGCLFKLEVQGDPLYRGGAGKERIWLWFFKRG